MDATQAIDFSDYEESDEESAPGQKKAIAYLQVLAQRDLSASKHPIYEGENFIGRHESNSIHMPYKALSKQHACIEVQGNSHLIYDMESRNKTRRGKMFLKANVRYELRDEDNLTFGDVKCQYIIQQEQEDEGDETGSDTDSELMLQPPDSEDTGQDKYSKDPTQQCVQSPKLEFKTPRRLDQGKVFAADSDEESPNNSNTAAFADDSFIPETQLSAKKKNDLSRVDESDSDTDIDETGPFDISALASAQTQAAMATQAVDNAETQAIDNMATLAVDNMETQAIDNMATIAVDNMETQAVDNMATLAVDNMDTQAVDNMATLAVDDIETQAVDNMATQAVDNMATQAIDNMATQAVDYSADSDSSDTDVDNVRQSLLEAPTQAVRQHHGTPQKYDQTLVLDSSSASSDMDDSPIKQAGRGRNIYDEPTQACDGIVSDSGSETDIEDGRMEAETQAVMRDEEDKIDEMATVPICQEDDESDVTDDEGTMATKTPDSNKAENLEDMTTVPIGTEDDDDDDDTDVEDGDDKGLKDIVAKVADVENMATIPIAAADDDDDTDIEEGSEAGKEKSAIKDEETDGTSDIAKGNEPILAPAVTEQDTDNTEIESEAGGASQEYFLEYKSEGNTAENPGPCEVEATQAYGGPSEDAVPEDEPSGNHSDDAVFDATQPYGGNEEDTPDEPTTGTSLTLEMASTQPYGDGENKKPDSHNDETDPTVPYGAEGDVAPGDSEIESTQAYGMQGGDTQIPDSQDGDDLVAPSSRFPVFKTQSPSRSCLKQPNTPEKKVTKARRVTFGPGDDEEDEESDDEKEAPKTGRRATRQPKGSKASSVPEQPSTSTETGRGRSRVSQRGKGKEVDAAKSDDAIGGRRSTRGNAESNEVAAMPGRKRKAVAADPAPSKSSAPKSTSESSAKRGRGQRGGKAEEEPDGGVGSVDELVTMTDAKPTRKKEFDAENPRPSRTKGSKVKDERKLSDSSISSVGSEGSVTGRALQTIVQMGKKITRISKRGKKSAEVTEQRETISIVVETRRSQRTAEVADDGDSDDTASLSSTASSMRDVTEVETSPRSTRGSRNHRKKVSEESDGPVTSGARRSRRGGKAETEESADLLVGKFRVDNKNKSGEATIETEVDGQSNSRLRKKGGRGDETQSQGDGEMEVSKRVGKGDKTESQNDAEVTSKRTKRGKTTDVKPDTQDKDLAERKVEPLSKPVKSSARGKTKAKISGDGDKGIQEETSESQDTTSKRSRRATGESQEDSSKETNDANVRHSGRRRTTPARFLDSKGNEKTSTSQKQDTKDTSSIDDSVFTVPKAVGRSSRQKQSKETSSSQKEVESETAQASSRGRRSTAKTSQSSVEKVNPEPVTKDTKSSKKGTSEDKLKAEETSTTPAVKRGRRATAQISETAEEEKAEDVKDDIRETSERGRRAALKTDSSPGKDESSVPESTPTQRGRRAAVKTSESSVEKGKSKEDGSRNTSKQGKRVAATNPEPVEESAADKSMATPATRGRRAVIPASSSKKISGESDKEESGMEDEKTPEVPKTRGKRGATTTPPPASPAKKPRQSTLPSSQTSPSASPSARRSRQSTLPTSQPSPSASPSARRPRQQTDLIALSPSLRRRVSDVRPKVMFTGVMDASWQKTVTTLGGELVDSVHDCTHLITDKVRRTVKFLCCVARGVIILTPNWLDESKTKKMFVDPAPYQLKDRASERQHGFSLPVSLQRAGEARLLKGFKIHVTSGVKPEPQQMKDIIKCAGGEFVAKLPTKSVPQMVVVSCADEKSLWAGPTKAGIPVVSSEFILTGILRQEILLKEYKLK